MDNVLAFLALKSVEIGFVLGFLCIIGFAAGVFIGTGALINLVMKKITRGGFDLDDALPYIIGSLVGGVLLVWIISNCIAAPIVAEKWNQNPEVNKFKIAFQHAFDGEIE